MSATDQHIELEKLAKLIQGDRSAFTELKKQYNDDLLPLLNFHGIALLVSKNGAVSARERTHLKQLKRLQNNAIAAELLKKQALNELGDSFIKNGLGAALIFKGTALAYSVYPTAWLRPRSDTDILLNADDKHIYEKVLSENGYFKQFGIAGEHTNHQSTWVKEIANGFSVHLDCHTRLSNRAILANEFKHGELLQNATPFQSLSDAWVQPDSVENLLIAIVHRIGHHANEERLIWLYDMHLLMKSFNENNWQQLLISCQKKQLCAIALEAIQLCQRLFNTPTNKTVLDTLKLAKAKDEPSQFFLKRHYPEWRHLLHDMRGLTGYTQKSQYLMENIFPDKDYIRQQMGTGSLTYAYVKRIILGIKKRL